MIGYWQLAVAAVAYAIGIVAQTTAAQRVEMRGGVDPGLLVRLATDRLFLVGFSAQVVGFGLSYLARATLPLYLVQAGTAAAVGLAAVVGITFLGWPVRGVEIAVLAVMATGLVLVVDAAEPSTAYRLSTAVLVGLVGVLGSTVALAVPAARLGRARAAVALGALAGVAFAVLAIACRSVADKALVTQLGGADVVRSPPSSGWSHWVTAWARGGPWSSFWAWPSCWAGSSSWRPTPPRPWRRGHGTAPSPW